MVFASLPARGAWIEINDFSDGLEDISQSLPARGAWIEITDCTYCPHEKFVAPRTGSVD